MIWIIGEYAERIDNADDLIDNFNDDPGPDATPHSHSEGVPEETH